MPTGTAHRSIKPVTTKNHEGSTIYPKQISKNHPRPFHTVTNLELHHLKSSLDFFPKLLHLLKQHLFQGPEGKGVRRSGWPEPYQGHITIGRFNKRETSSKLQLVSAVLFKIVSHSTGVHSKHEILNSKQQYNSPLLGPGFNPEHQTEMEKKNR